MESAWTKVVVALLCLFVILLAFGQFMIVEESASIATETAYAYTHTKEIEFDGVFLRDESVVYNTSNGVLSYECDDGAKVGRSSVVARRYNNESDIEYRRRIEELNAQITVLEEAQVLMGTDNSQLDSITSQISEQHSAIMDCLIDEDYRGADTLKNGLLGALCKREITRSDTEIGYADKINEYKAEVARLEQRISGDETKVYAGDSGFFVSNADGYEGKLNFDDADDLSASKIREIIEKPQLPVASGTVGKLIAEYEWRAAGIVDSKSLEGYYEGRVVELRIGSSADTVEAVISSVTPANDGQSVYVFECDRLTKESVSGRVAPIKIVLDTYGGIRVPRNSIRFNDADETGVYVLKGKTLVFRKINVIYWDKDYVICSKESADDYLKLYDEIVTEGKDLYEGKSVE